MKYVTVRFLNGSGNLSSGEYSYMTDLELAKGDWVVVEVSGNFKCVLVHATRGISKALRDKASKWVAQKIDVEAYTKLKEKAETIMEIRQHLRERKEEAEELLIYQSLAATDPVIQDLLKRLSDIDPEIVPALPNALSKEDNSK